MKGIEDYGKAPLAEKDKDTLGKKEKDISVGDILADKKQSAAFGKHIQSLPKGEGKDIAERLFKGTSTPEDKERLAAEKDIFLEQQRELRHQEEERRKEAQRIAKELKPDVIKRIAAGSPKLGTLLKVGGVEGIQKALISQLETIAIKDSVHFEKITQAYDQLIEETNRINVEVKEICNPLGVDMGVYLEILGNTPDDGERVDKLEEMVKGQMGVIRKWRTNEKVIRTQAEMMDNKNTMDALYQEYASELDKIGEVLAASINDNPELNKIFMNVVLKEEMPKPKKEEGEQESTFHEMRGAMPSEEDLKKGWEEQMQEYEKEGFDRTKPDDRKNFDERYVGSRAGGKTGTWSDVLKKFMMEAVSQF